MSGWPPCAHTSSAPCLRDSSRICSRVIDVASRATSATVVPAVLRPSTTSPMAEPYGRSTGPSQVLAGSGAHPERTAAPVGEAQQRRSVTTKHLRFVLGLRGWLHAADGSGPWLGARGERPHPERRRPGTVLAHLCGV